MIETFTTRDGLELGYRRVGEGAPLVCHPGGPGFSSRYFGDLGGLGEQAALVLLDPRGTAASERPQDARAYSFADYVSDLEDLRGHLGQERISLLGHSHGGMVAMAYAAAHPDRVEKLVLASTTARFAADQEHAMEEAMQAKAGEPWYADARDALEREQAGDFSSDAELAELAIREFPFYFARYGEREQAYLVSIAGEQPNGDALRLFNEEVFTTFDLRPELPRVQAPTLVITGEDDFITGPLSAREIAAAIPAAETVILEDCGHFIFVEQPERFREAVWAFLA